MAAKLTYNSNWYLPINIRKQIRDDPSAVRAEYTRLRDIAQKRLKRLAKSEFKDTQAYIAYRKAFPKLKDIRNDTDLTYKLSSLSRFVASPTSSISGLKKRRKQAIETLSEHGLKFVNESNYAAFGRFMEYYREEKLDEIYDSGDAADSFYIVEKHGLDVSQIQKDFEFWLDRENIDIASKMKQSTGKSKGSATRLRERITRQKKRKRSK